MLNPLRHSTFARFAVVGVGSSATHVIVATLLIERLAVRPTVANGCAFMLGTALSYSVNTVWSFRHRQAFDTLLRYLVVTGFGFLLTLLLSGLCAAAGLSYPWGIAAVILVVPMFNFTLHRHWTYRRPAALVPAPLTPETEELP